MHSHRPEPIGRLHMVHLTDVVRWPHVQSRRCSRPVGAIIMAVLNAVFLQIFLLEGLLCVGKFDHVSSYRVLRDVSDDISGLRAYKYMKAYREHIEAQHSKFSLHSNLIFGNVNPCDFVGFLLCLSEVELVALIGVCSGLAAGHQGALRNTVGAILPITYSSI